MKRQVELFITTEKNIIKLYFELDENCPIYVEFLDRNFPIFRCLRTFACNLEEIEADIAQYKKDAGLDVAEELFDLLVSLGYI